MSLLSDHREARTQMTALDMSKFIQMARYFIASLSIVGLLLSLQLPDLVK